MNVCLISQLIDLILHVQNMNVIQINWPLAIAAVTAIIRHRSHCLRKRYLNMPRLYSMELPI